MKTVSLKVAVPNSLLFVQDSQISTVPNVDYGEEASVWSIPTCIVINCLPDFEGDTSIVIGEAGRVNPDRKLLFDGILQTPSRKLVLETVFHDRLLVLDVPSVRNRVRVWADGRHICAQFVVIGIG